MCGSIFVSKMSQAHIFVLGISIYSKANTTKK